MDSSTITFIATLVIAFIFLRWFISSDDADELEQEQEAARESSSSASTATGTQQAQPQRFRRPVTHDMIEVVQQLAPGLTVGQIKLDLQRTGSVQETVDRFLSEGGLPFPEGEAPRPTGTTGGNDGQDSRNATDNIKPENLLKKYGVDANATSSGAETSKSGTQTWSDSADERASSLQQKKTEMILKARRRLESQLKNEQDLSKLEE
ncbi:Autocrine motility factor receptor [Wickerhamomyces ciferrii]|uniref:Autocrine motility factor receptor n=1 Tax=Wickerhamomyces ciferrii (strain ATCC 14091 / BCRC 22168 / CBS 111 / JCM 3599 / NBRC 0793 / NRRL Y-1031 F-60-10) TaxID=1206466 RepID=K0KAE6_WICCF|nr:Autocrine motility factor receptor [Wickerhamomyces ciferrii]CCH41935.1 Autocrine motility factor receptor [Wickerhamomyces ciferrii]